MLFLTIGHLKYVATVVSIHVDMCVNCYVDDLSDLTAYTLWRSRVRFPIGSNWEMNFSTLVLVWVFEEVPQSEFLWYS